MRWHAIAVSPLVHAGDIILPRFYSRTIPGKRIRASIACLETEAEGDTTDVDRVRRDMVWDAAPTAVAHFNSAGDSPMPLKVLERVKAHMEIEATLGGYEAAANVQEELEAVYSSAAQFINAKPDEIALQVCPYVRCRRHGGKSLDTATVGVSASIFNAGLALPRDHKQGSARCRIAKLYTASNDNISLMCSWACVARCAAGKCEHGVG